MYELTVTDLKQLDASTFVITTERPDVEIVAGQCFNLGIVTTGLNREYSMYSDANANYLQFLVKVVEDGIVSPALTQVNIGAKLQVAGPYGEFCIKNPHAHHTFIGTGTGIAPFRSFVKTFPDIDYEIIHGIRYASQQYDSSDYGTQRYHPCISRPENGAKPNRVTEYILNRKIRKDTNVFICGNRKMIADVFDVCRNLGLDSSSIHTEVFF